MMRSRLFVALIAAACFGHAAAGVFDEDARKEVAQVRAQNEAQNKENEARFQKLDESIKNLGIIQLLNQIEQLNSELSRLRGQIEVLSNQNEQLQMRQKDFYLDIDTRLRKLEGSPADNAASTGAPSAALPPPATAAATAPATAPTPGPAATAPATGGPAAPARSATLTKEQEKAYDKGGSLFMSNNYQAAIRAFETFMQDFPNSQLIPNAQYWIGLSYFNLKDYPKARAAEELLLKNYPESAKVPDAMLIIASVQQEAGDGGSARNTMEDIVAKYPASDAAAKARTRLSQPRR
jgi:tol-pal system protein YbgF